MQGQWSEIHAACYEPSITGLNIRSLLSHKTGSVSWLPFFPWHHYIWIIYVQSCGDFWNFLINFYFPYPIISTFYKFQPWKGYQPCTKHPAVETSSVPSLSPLPLTYPWISRPVNSTSQTCFHSHFHTLSSSRPFFPFTWLLSWLPNLIPCPTNSYY